ncbi:peptidoglycan DD-metalloendopeptidase family protein [Streptomyces sp. NPDC001380]|uniref:M23 family metallopeptidase n=1 Tax=Streptomyces sp. NPDC001380 TaxID=3364566 RepID=UPI0036C9917F
MASEGRHRRPRSSTSSHRLALAAGATGAGLGLPLAAAGMHGVAPAHADPDATAVNGDLLQNAAFTGTVRLPAPASAPTAGGAPAAGPGVHVVAPGETLSGIARSHRVPGGWRSVYLENRERVGPDPDRILPGQRLRLDRPSTAPPAPPAPRHAGHAAHVVRRGETLASIADEEDVDGGWQSVYRENRSVVGGDPDLILPGQRLTLPAAAPGRSAPAHPAPARPAPSRPAPAHHEPAHPAPPRHTPSHSTPSHHAPAVRAALPVRGYTLTAGYRASGSHWAHRHTGQDFAVPTGTRVGAALAGTVVTAGWGGAYGNEVVLRHRDGTYTLYGHLSSVAVHRGQAVAAGQLLGRSGATGNVTGPHLHFEVRNAPGYGSDIDPVAWLHRHGLHL